MHFAGKRIVRACTTVIAIPLLFACGKDGSGPIVTPPTQSISISVAPATLELNQGASGTVTITLTRSGGFTGAVNVAVEGLPAGVTIPGITIASSSSSGTLNVSAAAAAAAATSNLTIRATGTGVTAATASLSLTVRTVTNPVPSFAIGLSSGTASVAAGASGNVTVNVTRSGGFTGAVALAVSGAPAGLTASFNPASVTGASSTLTLNVGAAVAPGNYPLTVRGTAAGLTDQTAILTVTVTGGGGGGGSANWVFCGSTGLPLWFAFQDGTGAWTRVTGVNNALSFTITGARGGVAYVVPVAGGGFDLEVFYGSKAEIEAQGSAICDGASGAGVTVTGTIAGAAATDLVLVRMANSTGTTAASNTTYSIPGVPAGSFDLVAGKSALTLSGTSIAITPDKFFIRRNASSAAAGVIDFNGADAFAPQTASVTVNNLGGEQTLSVMSYFTASTQGALYVEAMPAAGSSRTFFGVPDGRRVATDFHFLNVIALPAGTAQPTTTRQAGVAFKAVANQTVTLGPALAGPTVTALAGARMRAVYNIQAEYNKFFIANYQQGTGANGRIASVLMTAGYLQGAATATLEVPDVVSVSGFDANWMLRPGVSTTATFTATGWPGSGGITSSPLAEGETYKSGTRITTVNTIN
jgi:hypothetical protein